jgi:hypothetical protein
VIARVKREINGSSSEVAYTCAKGGVVATGSIRA